MATGLNKVQIIGHLGQDPQVRSFPNGGISTTVSSTLTRMLQKPQTGRVVPFPPH